MPHLAFAWQSPSQLAELISRIKLAPLVALIALSLTSACAGHAARTVDARRALDRHDPNGALALHKGVASVNSLQTAGAKAAFQSKFGSRTNWAEQTTALLREHGFTGVGAWSDTETLRSSAHPVVYTRILNFMAGYGRKRGGTFTQPGHTGYPEDCIFVFDPAFGANSRTKVFLREKLLMTWI